MTPFVAALRTVAARQPWMTVAIPSATLQEGMPRLPHSCAIALTLAFVLVPCAASANDAMARAEQLFREAKTLTDSGQYPAACPKLEESERLDAALGTEFNLADCYEHTERPAKAFKLFRAVAAAAHAAGKDARERAARARADALDTQVGTVRIRFVTGSPPPGARITLDASEVPDVGSVQILTPGRHLFQVSGVGLASLSRDVVVTAQQTVEVLVPDLSNPPPVQEPPPPPPAREPTTSGASGTGGANILAYALGGAAIVGFGVGGVAGGVSLSEHNSAHAVCPVPSPCGDARAASAWTRATTAGNVATIGVVAGGVLGAAALVVWILTPAPTSGRVSSTCGTEGCSLAVRF